MANLTKNTYASGSVVETLVVAAAGGDTIQNFTSKDYCIVNNAHATLARTVTLVNQELSNHGTDVDHAITVAALTRRIIDPATLPGGAKRFQDSNGHLQITYSDSAADLTVGAFTRP
jgi:hypothetical protein